jgi:hypothetical protein
VSTVLDFIGLAFTSSSWRPRRRDVARRAHLADEGQEAAKAAKS